MLIRFQWLLNVPRLLSLTLHNVKVFSISKFIYLYFIYLYYRHCHVHNHYAICSWLASFGAVSIFVMNSQL